MTRYLIPLVALLATPCLAEEHRGPGRGPPGEAIAACSGLQPNAACSFTFNGQALSGTCHPGPQGRPTACRPAGHRPPPPEQDADGAQR